MNNYLSIYLLTRLGSLSSFCNGLMIVSVACLFCGLVFYPLLTDGIMISEQSADGFKKWLRRLPYIALFSGLLSAIIPDRQDAIMIIAGGKAMNYVQSDSSLNKLPYQTTAIISEYLDKQIKDLKEDKK